MAMQASRTAVLMSIHPEFADLILKGKKKIEFRKTRPVVDLSYVLIYATFPIKEVIGFFEVSGIHEAIPDDLWKIYQDVSGIDEKVFRRYYGSASRGVAIQVGKVFAFQKPFPLLLNGKHKTSPPQSFRYVKADAFPIIEVCCGSNRERGKSHLTCCKVCRLRIVRALASSLSHSVGTRRKNGNGS